MDLDSVQPHPPSPDALVQHAGFLRALARELVRDEHRAEDVVQSTFAATLQRGPGQPERLAGWLSRVARNVSSKVRRAEARRLEREHAVSRREEIEHAAAAIEREELLRSVTDAVLALDEPYRKTVLSRWYDGLDPQAIADRDGVPLATVKSRLQRAHARLRERLDDEHGRRDAWSATLLLWSESGKSATAPVSTAAVASGGILIMSAKLNWAAAVLVVLLASLVWWARTGSDDFSARAPVGEPPLRLAQVQAPAPIDPDPISGTRTAAVLDTTPVQQAAGTGRGLLEVRFLWPDGTLAAGVSARARPFVNENPALSAMFVTSDDQGVAHLDSVPCQIALDCNRGGSVRTEVAAGKTTEAVLQIPAGLAVDGIVVDPEGKPVPEAEIWIANAGDCWHGSAETRTDENGRFVLRDVARHHDIAARKPGFVPSKFGRVYAPPGERASVRLELGPPGALFHVTVLDDDGRPIEDALVIFMIGDHEPFPPFEERTDARGVAPPASLPKGECTLLVAARGWGPRREIVETDGTGDRFQLVRLERPVTIRGTVHDAGGAPVGKATINVGDWDLVEGPDQLMASTRTDGTFEIEGVAPGRIQVHAWKSEAGLFGETLGARPGRVLEWNPVLDAGRVLYGRIVDERGEGVADHWVHVSAVEKADRGWSRNTATSPDGRFQIANCPAGEMCVAATPSTGPRMLFNPGVFDHVKAQRGEVRLVLLASMRPTSSLSGRLVDAEGKALRFWLTLGRGGPNDVASSFVDPETGAFAFRPIPPGEYVLYCRRTPDGAWEVLRKLELRADENLDLGAITPPEREH